MSGRRLLVTGATGFVGSRLVQQALDLGWSLAIVQRSGATRSLPGELLSRLCVLEGSLQDCQALERSIAAFAPDSALHLAWTTEPGTYLESAANLDWLRWSQELFTALARSGCRHVVFVGTCAEYDTDVGYLREDGPLRPTTLYAASKAALRLIVRELARQSGSTLGWARLFYLYGPGENAARLVPGAIHALARGEIFRATAGEQVRDYLHVDDAAAALLALVSARASGDYNVCSGLPVAVSDVLCTIAAELGASERLQLGALPARAWDPPFICGNPSKLRELGFRPRFTLHDGIKDTLAWWQARKYEATR